MPEFLSAWTDEDGGYHLETPAGATVYLAAARQFPPEAGAVSYREIPPQQPKQALAVDMSLPLQ
jgi:hypothetical protein